MISLQDVEAAETRIRDYAARTLFKRSTFLSDLLGIHLYQKFENMQHTGSFKIRGAANKLLVDRSKLTSEGVVAASAGNHAQGVAKMATTLGIKSRVVMPEATPIVKVQSTRAYGAEVVLHGDSLDEAFAHAHELCQKTGATFIHPFDDPLIMAGQGTAGLEIIQDLPDPDVVIVPIGGGGLMGGIATVIRARSPKTKIIGVQTERSPNVGRKVLDPKRTDLKAPEMTFAEGIAVKHPSDRVVKYLHSLVDDVIFVSEEELAEAVLVLLEKVKSVVEGAGAAALAALLSQKLSIKTQSKVVVVLSGGNVDVRLLGNIIEHGLSIAGRTLGVRLIVDDRPGALMKITEAVAKAKGNVLQVYHHRHSPRLGLGQTEIELHVETRDREHREKVLTSLEQSGFSAKRTF